MASSSYFIVFIALLPAVLGCGNVEVVVEKMNTDCPDGSTSILQISDFGFTLSDKCILTPTGCVDITKDIKGSMMTYKVKNEVMTLAEGKSDVCEVLEDEEKSKDLKGTMKLFNMPIPDEDCSVKAQKVCAAGQNIDISEHSSKLMFATGRITAEIISEHEDGTKSCLNAVIKVSRKMFG